MSKKLLILFIIFSLFSGLVGGLILTQKAQANVLDNILDFLKESPLKKLGVPLSSTTTEPVKQPEVPLYKPVVDYEQAVIKAVEIASPSVVSIVITKDLPKIENCPYDPFSDLPFDFRRFFGGNFEFYVPCERGTQKQEIGGGSGFIVSEDGLILTNKHVVLDEKADYTVLTNDGKKYSAKVLARDPYQDLAIIKIEAKGLKPAQLGDSDSVKLGQTAIAIGNALGEFRNTVSVGVISGLARNIVASGGSGFTERIEGVIQTDAAINQGNSGGPLLNLKGEVIGINTAIVSNAQNIGFAIPINQAKRAIESVKKTGTIKSPYLGVRYIMINEEIAKKQNLTVNYGALVRGSEEGPAVIVGSPAEKAGLQAEDIILEVDGEKLNEGKVLGSVIQKYNIGDTITLTVLRANKTFKVKVTLEERPKNL